MTTKFSKVLSTGEFIHLIMPASHPLLTAVPRLLKPYLNIVSDRTIRRRLEILAEEIKKTDLTTASLSGGNSSQRIIIRYKRVNGRKRRSRSEPGWYREDQLVQGATFEEEVRAVLHHPDSTVGLCQPVVQGYPFFPGK
jgi:hypothetical protein